MPPTLPPFLSYLESSLDSTQKTILRHFQGEKLSEYLHDEAVLEEEEEEDSPDLPLSHKEEINVLLKFWSEELIFRLTMHISSNLSTQIEFSETSKMNHVHFQRQIAESVGFSAEDARSASLGTLPSEKYQQEIFALQQRIYLMNQKEQKLREDIEKQEILLENRQKKMEAMRKEHLIRIHGLSRDLDAMVHSNETYAQYFDNVMQEIAHSQEKANKHFADEDALTQFHDLNNDPQWEGVMKQLRKQRYAFRHVFRKHRTILSMLRDKTDHLLHEARKRKRHDGTELQNLVARRRTVLKDGKLDEEDVIRMVSFAEAKNVACQTNEAVVWSRASLVARASTSVGEGDGVASSTASYAASLSSSSGEGYAVGSLEERLMEQGNMFVDKIIQLEEEVSNLSRKNHWLNMELEDYHARGIALQQMRRKQPGVVHYDAQYPYTPSHHQTFAQEQHSPSHRQHQNFAQHRPDNRHFEAPHLHVRDPEQNAEMVTSRADGLYIVNRDSPSSSDSELNSETGSEFTSGDSTARGHRLLQFSGTASVSEDANIARDQISLPGDDSARSSESINIVNPSGAPAVNSGMRVKISDHSRRRKRKRQQVAQTAERATPQPTRPKESRLHISKQFVTKETKSPAARAEHLLEQLMSLSHEIDEYNARGDEKEFMHTFSKKRNSRFVDDHIMLNPMSPRRNSLEVKSELMHMGDRRTQGDTRASYEVITQQRDFNLEKNSGEFFSVMKKPIAQKPGTSGSSRKQQTAATNRTLNSSSSSTRRLPLIKTMQNQSSAEQLYELSKRPPIQIDIERTLAYQKQAKPLIAAPIFKVNRFDEEWDLE